MANDITPSQDSWHRRQVEAEIQQARQLLGFTVTGICHTGDFGSFGLTLRRGRKTLNVWVDCDPEGNGPGHLNIEEGS
jgi:hypothetical protein